jgi:hypothetical protein
MSVKASPSRLRLPCIKSLALTAYFKSLAALVTPFVVEFHPQSHLEAGNEQSETSSR